ncbi:MAG TPA: class I SAM-dependent methyltransferase [Chitinophagaceae bacterium]|nr:class I SAM-dependent methyltransferase [Chitinophagaceae bacterium]
MAQSITLINPVNRDQLNATNGGFLDRFSNFFPFRGGACRIVSEPNYTESFGFQWNKFVKTQIDQARKMSRQSYTRLFAVTGWDKENLEGKNILEAGSGAGRFTQVILNHTKANLYSIDYSNAVEANYKNNGPNERLHLFQASVYEMPFAPAQFDKVFCFGVIQHTPDVRKTVKSLIEMAKPGGEVIVDFYCVRGWWTKIHAKYLFRPVTKKWSNEKLLMKIEKNVDWMIRLTTFFNKIGIGRIVNRFIPICDIKNTLPKDLSQEELREWCILDTFDMFSPKYDQPQKVETVKKWFQQNGMKDVWGGEINFGNGKAHVVKGIKA